MQDLPLSLVLFSLCRFIFTWDGAEFAGFPSSFRSALLGKVLNLLFSLVIFTLCGWDLTREETEIAAFPSSFHSLWLGSYSGKG